MSDEAVLRRIKALLARAEDGASSPAEVAKAIAAADKLMRAHDLTRDEVRLRAETLARESYNLSAADSRYANPLALAVSRLADCRVALADRDPERHRYQFRGLAVDVAYADWLFRTTVAALQRSWTAFRASPEGARIADGGSAMEVRHLYLQSFVHTLVGRIEVLWRANSAARPPALVAVKQERLDAAFGLTNSGPGPDTPSLSGDLARTWRGAAAQSRSVPLRQQLGG